VGDHHHAPDKLAVTELDERLRHAFWVETSSAEVISSAMSNDGFNRVEMTITMRCFIATESSMGYRSRTSVAGRPAPGGVRSRAHRGAIHAPRLPAASTVILPILRVGFIALMAYCG